LTYRLFADDVAAFMDALDLSSAFFAGFSDGGCTSLELAMNYPEKVKKMVLLGTPYNISNYFPGVLDEFKAIKTEDDFNRRMMFMWSNYPVMSLDDLSRNTKPVLVLHAEREEYFDVTHSQDLAKTLKGDIDIVPNSGHNSPNDYPEFLVKAIADFCI